MILLPFFLDTSNPIRLGIFRSEGGRSFWQVEDTCSHFEILSMLTCNGLPVVSLETVGPVIFARIDHINLKLNDFYLLSDVDPDVSDKDVWQLFTIPSTHWYSLQFKLWFIHNSALFMGGSGHLNYQGLYD